MTTESAIGIEQPASSQNDLVQKARRLVLTFPAITLLMGLAFIAVEPRFGLFSAALILGWTQLVGL